MKQSEREEKEMILIRILFFFRSCLKSFRKAKLILFGYKTIQLKIQYSEGFARLNSKIQIRAKSVTILSRAKLETVGVWVVGKVFCGVLVVGLFSFWVLVWCFVCFCFF